MSGVTGWALRTWLKFTLALLLVVGGIWLFTGTGALFWFSVAFAALLQWWLIRQLAREWTWQARGSWWWAQ